MSNTQNFPLPVIDRIETDCWQLQIIDEIFSILAQYYVIDAMDFHKNKAVQFRK